MKLGKKVDEQAEFFFQDYGRGDTRHPLHDITSILKVNGADDGSLRDIISNRNSVLKHKRSLKRLTKKLGKRGVDVNYYEMDNEGNTLLHHAILYGNYGEDEVI